jgi:hypothetical protein
MNRRGAWIAVAATLTSLLFAAVSTSGGVSLWGEPQWDPTPGERSPLEIDSAFEPGKLLTAPEDARNDPIGLPEWLSAVLQVVVVVIVFVTAIAVLMIAWRDRPRVRWRRKSTAEGDFEVLPDIAAAVVEQAAAQRAALLDGAPRNAIVQCWLRLERDVAAAGLARDPADTSLEFTERVLARYTVDPEAITELAALYREARFSDHLLEESHRRTAFDALDRLHHTLGESTIGAAT